MGGEAEMGRVSRRLLFVVVVAALACAYATSEAELSGDDKGPFTMDGKASKALANAKKTFRALQRKGGVKGIPNGGKLMKKEMVKADAQFSKKAKKKLKTMRKVDKKMAKKGSKKSTSTSSKVKAKAKKLLAKAKVKKRLTKAKTKVAKG